MKKLNQNEDYNYIAETLRCLRVRADFSQQNIADILNLNRSTYTYYETGKTTPDVRTLNKIAHIFGVSIEVFFPEEGKLPVFQDPAWDTNKQRPRKAVSANPQTVGDLKPDEKTLIALLRSDDRISAASVVDTLKKRLAEADAKKA